MTMRSVGLMQEFTRADKRAARAARLEREAEAADTSRAMTLADLRRDTALAWLDRYYQERLRELLHTQRAELALQIEAAEAAYRGGRGAQADVFGARAALAQLEDRISQTRLQVATATTRLARWIGAAATQALAAAPDVSIAPLDAAGLDTQLAHHPQIALMDKQEALARAEVDIAQSNKRADWSVELMLSQRGSAYSNMVSLNVSIPLQWDQKNRQDREVASKLALAQQARAQRDDAIREHRAQTLSWLQQWQSGRERLQRYDTTLIALAAERTQAAQAAYRGGSGSLMAVLEARRMESEARVERLRVEMDTATAWAQLTYLIAPEHRPVGERQEPQR
jgi:outer membrane protein TolC